MRILLLFISIFLLGANVSEVQTFNLLGSMSGVSSKKQVDGNIIYNTITRTETNPDGSKDLIGYDGEGSQVRTPLYGAPDFSQIDLYNPLIVGSEQEYIIKSKLPAIQGDKAVTGLGTLTTIASRNGFARLLNGSSSQTTTTGKIILRYQEEGTVDNKTHNIYIAQKGGRRIVKQTGSSTSFPCYCFKSNCFKR